MCLPTEGFFQVDLFKGYTLKLWISTVEKVQQEEKSLKPFQGYL